MVHPPERAAAITIMAADDHHVMRSGQRMLLEAEGGSDVVAEAGTIQAGFRDVRTHRPAVLVLDLNMPGGSGVDANWTAAARARREPHSDHVGSAVVSARDVLAEPWQSR